MEDLRFSAGSNIVLQKFVGGEIPDEIADPARTVFPRRVSALHQDKEEPDKRSHC
jgi:hypothetical protein